MGAFPGARELQRSRHALGVRSLEICLRVQAPCGLVEVAGEQATAVVEEQRVEGSGFSLHQIRVIVSRCEELFEVPRPLVTLRFKVDGKSAFVEADDSLVDLGLTRRKRQRAWDEVLGPFLVTIEYEGDLARRWWPLGPTHHVLVDPELSLGLPVVEGSGVRTEILLEQFHAGRDPEHIATDFNLTRDQVLDAIRFESRLDATSALQTA